jgi:hypothetical protein
VGRSALWVARQHGHSIETMLRSYAAWTAGSFETDIAAIKAAMAAERVVQSPATQPGSNQKPVRSTIRPFEIERETVLVASQTRAPFANGLANRPGWPTTKCLGCLEKIWRRERDSNPRRAFDPSEGS